VPEAADVVGERDETLVRRAEARLGLTFPVVRTTLVRDALADGGWLQPRA
jgi:hypothetical protein